MQNICITFLQCWTNVEANVVQMFCLLGKGELYMILLTDGDGSQYSHHMSSSTRRMMQHYYFDPTKV